MLDGNVKAYVIHVSFLSLKLIHWDRKAQIPSLLTKKVIVLEKHLNFASVFSK